MAGSIADSGFAKDCQKLLSNFRANNGIDFSNFCDEWKAMNFHYIFSGFRNDIEMIFNINEYFTILKAMFLSSQSLLDKIGIIFLMYAIYYKQPPKEYCKIKVTIDEWQVFKEFYEKLHAHEEFNKIKLIFWTMLQSGAFIFVESESKYTFEYFMRKEYDDEIQKESTNLFRNYYQRIETKLTNPESGILPALKYLEDAYNEMKDLLDTPDKTKKSLPSTSIVSELYSGFKTISNIFEIEPIELESDQGARDSTDSDDLREQVETSIKQRRDAIKRRAVKKKNTKTQDDSDSESDDEDGRSVIEPVKTASAKVTKGENSLKIQFSKPLYEPRDLKKSAYSKLLDSIGKAAADELQEEPNANIVPTDTVQPSLDIIS